MNKRRREIIVTCSEAEGSVSRVADRLRKLGFHVEYVLESAGSVVGSWDAELDPLKAIPGVIAVEESEEKFPL